jgi:hypothetical protein
MHVYATLVKVTLHAVKQKVLGDITVEEVAIHKFVSVG